MLDKHVRAEQRRSWNRELPLARLQRLGSTGCRATPGQTNIAIRSSRASIPTRASPRGRQIYRVPIHLRLFPASPSHSRASSAGPDWQCDRRPTQLDFGTLGLSRAVFAPTIEEHDGTFYILNTWRRLRRQFLTRPAIPTDPGRTRCGCRTWMAGSIRPCSSTMTQGYILNNARRGYARI